MELNFNASEVAYATALQCFEECNESIEDGGITF